MSQEETPKPAVPDAAPPALDVAPEAAPAAPGTARAPSFAAEQAASDGEHLVEPAGAAAQSAGDAGEAAPGGPTHPDHPHRRRRRRRRHRKAPPLDGGAAPAVGASSGEIAVAPAASDGPSDGLSGEGGAGLRFSEGGRPILSLPEAAPASPSAPSAPARPGEHKRRRRRRRRGKRPEGALPAQEPGAASHGENAGTAAASDAAPAPEGGTGERPPRARFPRQRWRRDRREGGAPRTNDGAPREGASREDRPPREDRPRRERSDRVPRDRERGDRQRGPGDGKKRFGKKGFGPGRDDRRPKEQPKLYSFESIVDRGFEDVADPANDGATRRVDWQIVKRTVADQKSAKPVSSVYLVRRDGVDTDFANLAAARQAVNKTIVHPEKLTRPKADYPSTKK